MVTRTIDTTAGSFLGVLTVYDVTGIAEERGYRLGWANVDGTGYIPALGLATSSPFRTRRSAEEYATIYLGGMPASETIRRAEGIAFLMRDGNLSVPGGRYGRDTAACAPIAWRLAYIVARESGEPMTYERLEHAMGLVVNSHDDVATIIREHGGRKWS